MTPTKKKKISSKNCMGVMNLLNFLLLSYLTPTICRWTMSTSVKNQSLEAIRKLGKGWVLLKHFKKFPFVTALRNILY